MTISQRSRLLFFLPAFCWLGIFFFVPLGIVLFISFMKPGSPVEFTFTLGHYARLGEPLLFRIFLRTLLIAALTTLLCLAAGYPLAFFIVRRPPLLRRFLYFLVVIPFMTNSLILTYSWMILLRVNGLVDQVARWIGWMGAEESLFLLNTPGAVILGMLYWYLPFMIYPIYTSLEKLDWTLVDAASDLGASGLDAFRRVIFPLSLPGVVAGCLLVFISSLGNFVIPKLLGGAKQSLIGNIIQDRFLSQPQNWPLGSAVAIAMMLLVTTGIWLYFRWAGEGAARV